MNLFTSIYFDTLLRMSQEKNKDLSLLEEKFRNEIDILDPAARKSFNPQLIPEITIRNLYMNGCENITGFAVYDPNLKEVALGKFRRYNNEIRPDFKTIVREHYKGRNLKALIRKKVGKNSPFFQFGGHELVPNPRYSEPGNRDLARIMTEFFEQDEQILGVRKNNPDFKTYSLTEYGFNKNAIYLMRDIIGDIVTIKGTGITQTWDPISQVYSTCAK